MILLRPGQRLLIRGVNWLGDAVMSTPALARIREANPGVEITLLTPGKLAELWLDHPAIDRVIPFSPEDGLLHVGQGLRRQRFHASIALPNSHRSALELWLARIPVRIGVVRPWRRWFLTHPVAPRPGETPMHRRSDAEVRALLDAAEPAPKPGLPIAQAHHIHQYLHLARALGARTELLPPFLPVQHERQSATLSRFGLGTEAGAGLPLLALNAGAEYGPAKRWPKERFIEAAVGIVRHVPCRWAVIGGAGDVPLAEEIVLGLNRGIARLPGGVGTVPPAVALAGRTTLREVTDILAACRLLLTNDTGPMHLAAAVGTPVVALFGSTTPTLTGPGLPGDPAHRLLEGRVACTPCFRRQCPVDLRCLASVTVEQVVRAMLEVLGRTRTR